MRRIPQLDGLRGVAILLVLVWHYAVGPGWPLISRVGILCWSGVDLFFVLSGFLIGGILIDSRDSPNYFRNFYIRRAFRILPIYLLLTAGYFVVCAAYRPILGAPMPWHAYFTFTQNFWLAHRSWNDVYLTASWSLAIEEQFYLLLPFTIRLLPKRLLLPVAMLLTFASVVARCALYLYHGQTWGTAAYTLLICRADSLMLGVICAILVRKGWADNRFIRALIQALMLLSGLGIAISLYRGWGMGTLPMCTLGFSCLAVFYASVLLTAVTRPIGRLSTFLQSRMLIWLGRISYGLYLFHGAIPISKRYILLDLAAALVLAQLSWKYFESKMVGLGHSLSR